MTWVLYRGDAKKLYVATGEIIWDSVVLSKYLSKEGTRSHFVVRLPTA